MLELVSQNMDRVPRTKKKTSLAVLSQDIVAIGNERST